MGKITQTALIPLKIRIIVCKHIRMVTISGDGILLTVIVVETMLIHARSQSH